jgi:hypothetical protein
MKKGEEPFAGSFPTGCSISSETTLPISLLSASASTLALALLALPLLALSALFFSFLTALFFHRIVLHGFLPFYGQNLRLKPGIYAHPCEPPIREIPVPPRIAP